MQMYARRTLTTYLFKHESDREWAGESEHIVKSSLSFIDA